VELLVKRFNVENEELFITFIIVKFSKDSNFIIDNKKYINRNT